MRALKAIRLRHGLSQADLSAKTSVAEFTISEIEAGKRNPRPSTLRKLAQGLDVEVADLYGEPEHPLGEAPPATQPSFNGLLEEERRFRYLSSWRAFVWQLVRRWEEDSPKTSREIAVVLEAMQALIDERAFEHPPEQITTSDEREASEWMELSLLFRGIQRLNEIADTVEVDRTAQQQRRELLKALPGELSA